MSWDHGIYHSPWDQYPICVRGSNHHFWQFELENDDKPDGFLDFRQSQIWQDGSPRRVPRVASPVSPAPKLILRSVSGNMWIWIKDDKSWLPQTNGWLNIKNKQKPLAKTSNFAEHRTGWHWWIGRNSILDLPAQLTCFLNSQAPRGVHLWFYYGYTMVTPWLHHGYTMVYHLVKQPLPSRQKLRLQSHHSSLSDRGDPVAGRLRLCAIQAGGSKRKGGGFYVPTAPNSTQLTRGYWNSPTDIGRNIYQPLILKIKTIQNQTTLRMPEHPWYGTSGRWITRQPPGSSDWLEFPENIPLG